MRTIRIAAAALVPGEDIVEWSSGGKPMLTRVNEIERRVCSRTKVHVNGKWCYDWNYPVEVAL